MKKTIILLLIFVGLGFAAMKYLQEGTGAKGNVEGNFEMLFAIENADDIHKVFLADRKGNNTTLTRNGEDWIYNGEYKARPDAIKNMLDAMTRVRVKFRPADTAVDYIAKELGAGGIKVEAYDKNDQLIKAYYVGGSSQDMDGTNMILEDSDEPLVCHIPSWAGTLYNRFSLIGEEWRDRTVFSESPDNIQSVKVEYPDPEKINHSFILERKNKTEFSLRPMHATTRVIEKPLMQGMVEGFLVEFESKIAEAFRNSYKDREAVVKQLPFCVITLTNTSGVEKRVKFFPIYEEDKIVGKEDDFRVLTNRPVFRYFAEIDGKDLVLVQQGVLGKLFWSYGFFFEKNQ